MTKEEISEAIVDINAIIRSEPYMDARNIITLRDIANRLKTLIREGNDANQRDD